jgi:DNA-binding CsgD family transcriptional regulator
MGGSMNETEQLSELVGRVYDAALDPALWPTVLGETCRFVDCVSGTLNSYDTVRSSLAINVSHGYDPDYVKLLLERYIHINPMVEMALRTDVGDVLSVHQVMDYETLTQTVFWREWAKPQGFVDAIQATLDKTPTAMAALTVVRHERAGMADETALRRTRLLFPHFRRAIVIGKVIDLHKVETAALADTIDGIMAAVLLVDGVRRVVYANPSGQSLLEAGALFAMDPSGLSFRDAGADRAFREIIATLADSGEAGIGATGIAIPLAADGQRYVAHVLPLITGARRAAGLHYAAVAAIFVRRAELDPATAFDAISTTFRLTPNETRVLAAVVEINGAAAIGSVLGMSEATVKTHLHHLFEKTGAARQADLVRLVAGYASPLSR